MNEEKCETLNISLPSDLLARARAEAERRGLETAPFFIAALAFGVAQSERETRLPDAIIHAKKSHQERDELQDWTKDFFGRYDQALRNLAR